MVVMGYRVSGDPVQRLRGWCPAGKHESELFLECLCLPLDSASALLCAVRWVIAARRRLSVSLESPSRAYHHVLGLFSVAIIERTEGTGTRWTVGAEPTEKVSRGLPSTSTNPGQRLLRGFDDPGQKYEAKDRKGRRLVEGATGCIWGCSPESLARPEGQTAQQYVTQCKRSQTSK